MIIRGDDRGEAEKNWTLVTNTLTFLSTSMYKRGKERWCTHYSIRFNPLAFRCVSPPLAVILLAPVCYSCIFFSFSYLIADTSHRLSERWCSCCRFRSRKRGSVWLTRGATTTTSPASHPSSSALSTSFFFYSAPFPSISFGSSTLHSIDQRRTQSKSRGRGATARLLMCRRAKRIIDIAFV